MLKSLILLFALSVFTACKTSKKSQSVPINKNAEIAYPLAEIGVFPKQNDPYQILDAKIEGHYLHLEVSYGGGCAEHEWKLIGSPNLSNDPIPVRDVMLVHQANGDQCKALKQEKLTFAISPLGEYKENQVTKLNFAKHKIQLDYRN